MQYKKSKRKHKCRALQKIIRTKSERSFSNKNSWASIYVSSLTNICCKNDKFLERGQVFKEKSPHLLTAAIPAAKLALRETLIRPWFVFLFAPFVQHIVCLIPICTAQFTLYSPNFQTDNSKVEWGGGGVFYIQWKIRQWTFQSCR